DLLSSRSRVSFVCPAPPPRAAPAAVPERMSQDIDVTCCATSAILIPVLLTAGNSHHGERSGGLKASARRRKKVGHASTHAENGVERACVVGTTGTDHIPLGAVLNKS